MAVAGSCAHAAPEEIQVYMDEMDRPGEIGLDSHINYVARGDATTGTVGQQQSLHQLRLTPEFSYGITPNLEAGLYLPLATLDGAGHAGAYGIKGRLKYIAPRAEGQDWWIGANFELGRVGHQLDINPWNAEFKGIIGTQKGPWILAFNLNLDFVVSGPQRSPLSFDGDTKVSYSITRKLALGIESYNGLGDTRAFGRFGGNEHSTFVTVDTALGPWDLNLGLGRGYGANPDHLIVKAIIGVPIDRLFHHRPVGP